MGQFGAEKRQFKKCLHSYLQIYKMPAHPLKLSLILPNFLREILQKLMIQCTKMAEELSVSNNHFRGYIGPILLVNKNSKFKTSTHNFLF